jgi:hypothetical protein
MNRAPTAEKKGRPLRRAEWKEKASTCCVRRYGRSDAVGWRAARKREELPLDSNDLPGLNRFESRQASRHERQQVLQAV